MLVSEAVYNHTPISLAPYSNEKSYDKWSKSWKTLSFIVIQMHDKLHESFLHADFTKQMKVVENQFKKVNNIFIEKACVKGKHWSKRKFQWVPTKYVTKQGKQFCNLLKTSNMYNVFASFKHLKLPISIGIPVTLPQIVIICMAAIYPNSVS